MEWFLAVLIILTIVVNIRSFMIMSQLKEQKAKMMEGTDAINQSIGAFVANVEKENEELYQKLIDYIKAKESKLDERLRDLEGNIVPEIAAAVEAAEPAAKVYSDGKSVPKHEEAEQENDKISKLYKQGFSVKQIAKVLQLDHSKVELAIKILKKKNSYHK